MKILQIEIPGNPAYGKQSRVRVGPLRRRKDARRQSSYVAPAAVAAAAAARNSANFVLRLTLAKLLPNLATFG